MNIDINTMGSLLDDLWLTTIKELITKIKSGQAAPTDIGNAIKMLRDNGVVMDAKAGKETLEELIQNMTSGEMDPDSYIGGKLQIEVTDCDLEGDEIRQ